MVKSAPTDLQNQVLHLDSWPSLPSLLPETVPDMTRICALLARRPSVGMLIPILLNIPAEVAYAMLETLHAGGHIHLKVSLPPEKDVPPALAQDAASTDFYFLEKLWKRLIQIIELPALPQRPESSLPWVH
jgi:hypothetical protein